MIPGNIAVVYRYRRNSLPLSDEVRAALLAGTAEVASMGEYEVYKTRMNSTAHCGILFGWANWRFFYGHKSLATSSMPPSASNLALLGLPVKRSQSR